VAGEAPAGRSIRLSVTEHGISYPGRPRWKRSAHTRREGDGSKGEDEKVVLRREGALAVDK
jgi:hypothetical protein